MIEVKNITKTYYIDQQPLRAADNVSFTISNGEMVSIVGHSGSGKTTLLSLIGGLTKPDSGNVLIDKTDLWAMNDENLSAFRNQKLSFIFQFASLVPTLTALENVMLPTAFGDFTENVAGYAEQLLAIVGLKDKINAYPAHLSGGQQRRVAIARAYINRPEIILADEPTGDLDEGTEQEIMQLFHRTNKENGITFIIVTHSREIADQAVRRMKMSNGILSELI